MEAYTRGLGEGATDPALVLLPFFPSDGDSRTLFARKEEEAQLRTR